MSSASEFDRVPDGYPKLAVLMSKDEDYIIFRRFSNLNARNLLYLQDELVTLEKRLDSTDNDLQKISKQDALKSRERFCEDIGRKELVLEIRRLLAEYNSAVMQWSHIQDVPSPSSRRVQGFKRWMKYADPVNDSSMTYVEKTLPRGESGVAGARQPTGVLDLLALKKEVDSWIGTFLRHSWLKFIFIRDMIYLNNRKEAFIFYNSSAIDTIVTGTAVASAIVLTIVGIVTLGVTSQEKKALRLGLIAIFTSIIAAVLALAGAKKSEILIGTIGYVAVMVVFVSGETSK